jgi:hypothetical protein
MKQPAPDQLHNNKKRLRFNQLAQDQPGVRTGKAYAADLRKAGSQELMWGYLARNQLVDSPFV